MKIFILILIVMFFLMANQSEAQSVLDNFISRQGDKLMDGEKELRFISFNIPDLHYIDDYQTIESKSAFKLPNEFEIADAFKSIKQMGGGVIRTYTISVRKKGDDKSIPKHVLAPGEFNENAFRALDKVLELANDHGIRVIIPFVCNYNYWGRD